MKKAPPEGDASSAFSSAAEKSGGVVDRIGGGLDVLAGAADGVAGDQCHDGTGNENHVDGLTEHTFSPNGPKMQAKAKCARMEMSSIP
jgi:hypothetical protein